MFNPERLLQQMVGGALGKAFGGRSRRGLGVNKAAVGIGLLGVALAAYDHYQGSQRTQTAAPAGPPPPPMPPPTPIPPPPAAVSAVTRAQPALSERQREAALLVRAMIGAAAADGLIDADERRHILSRAEALGDDADTLTYLEAEMRNPVSVEQLIAQTPASQADAVYAAAALAITLDTEAERAWLTRLADGLGFDAARRDHLNARIGLA